MDPSSDDSVTFRLQSHTRAQCTRPPAAVNNPRRRHPHHPYRRRALHANPHRPRPGPWRWTRYPEVSGTGVECLTQTTDGAMWFGVDDGVIRYDGLEWQHFGVDDGIYGDEVTVLHAGPDGMLFAGTAVGISPSSATRGCCSVGWQIAWMRAKPAISPTSAHRRTIC